MIISRRFGPLFCSLKRVHADIFMLACTLSKVVMVWRNNDKASKQSDNGFSLLVERREKYSLFGHR